MKVPLDKFEEWLINKNLKERTVENYIYYFNKFTFDVFNQETISRFLSDKTNRNSIGRSFLVNFQKFLIVNHKELGISKDHKVEIMETELPKLTGRVKHREVKPIQHEHISVLERFLDNEKEKLQLLLSYYCALRLGELIKIKILSFDWEKWKKDTSKMGECWVFGKGDREGLALIPSSIMKRISVFIKNKKFSSLDSYIFISNNGNINLKNRSRSWQMKLRQAGIKSRITKLDEKGKPIHDTVVHPHRLRHSYASYLRNIKKMDIMDIKEIVRHASISSTQIYVHIDRERLKEELS